MHPKKQAPIKRKILLAAHIGEPRGGVSTYFETLIDSDLKNRVDLHFVETSKGALSSASRGKRKFVNWINGLENVLRFLFALLSVRPDLVHIGTTYSFSFIKHSVMLCLARLFFIPVLIQPHCSISKLLPEDRPIWKKYALLILKQSAGILALSKEWEILSDFLPEAKIFYIPNAINAKLYSELPRPRENANGHVNILFMGHITAEKGIFDLIQAAQMISSICANFTINIVGEYLIDEEAIQLKDMIDVNGLQEYIKIYGPAYGKEQIGCFSSADIFVLPSYHEGMPMSVIEAMAAGLPVVASNVGGIPDLIENQKMGVLVRPGDILTLSTSLVELIKNSKKRLSWGMEGRRRAIQNFDIEERIKALISAYETIICAGDTC